MFWMGQEFQECDPSPLSVGSKYLVAGYQSKKKIQMEGREEKEYK